MRRGKLGGTSEKCSTWNMSTAPARAASIFADVFLVSLRQRRNPGTAVVGRCAEAR
jgi:hypothetical protein